MTQDTTRSLATVARLMTAYFEGEMAAVRHELDRAETTGNNDDMNVLQQIAKNTDRLRDAWAELVEATEQAP